MDRHRGLAIAERGELLRARHRNRAVARDHALHQPAHHLQPERQRNHIEQQPVVTGGTVASQQIGLHGGAERHHLIRIDVGQRRLAEQIGDRLADMRHPRRTANQHHALDVRRLQTGIAQRVARGVERLVDQMLGHAGKGIGRDVEIDPLPGRQARLQRGGGAGRQRFLDSTRLDRQQALVLRRQQRQIGLLQRPAIQPVVEVIAAERGVAAGSQHLEHALGEAEDRDVEGAAAEVIDRVDAFGGVVQPVGQRGRGRFVQQAQHVQASDARGVARGLALRVVEVRRHRDHRADQRPAERSLGTLAQVTQDVGRHLDRAAHTGSGADLQHPRRIDEVVRQVFDVVHVLDAAPHEALDRDHGAARIAGLMRNGIGADLRAAIGQVANHRGQQRPPLFIGQHFRHAMPDSCDQRIGGAQIDPHREAMLVRGGRHAGFGDLQQRHLSLRARCRRNAPAVRRGSGQ